MKVKPLAAVALTSAALIAAGTNQIPMAAAYQDRISQIRSQDEDTYSRVSLEMLFGGHWLTPRLLGRFFLYKPPLLYWLSALSVKYLGLSRLTLRLPSVIAGALAVTIVFAWCNRLSSWRTGLIAAILMLSNSVWQTLSRLACMDVLLTCSITLAMALLIRDPTLSRRSSALAFGAATAAALMTKSIAGVIPILVLIPFAVVKRVPLRRVILALIVAAALAAPWHIYQLITHRQWFLTEYIGAQLVGFGAHPPVQPGEPAPWFYARRLFLTDPVLAVLFLIGLPGLVLALRRRSTPAILLSLWLAVTILAVCAFQSRNFLYAALLIPLMCLVAAGYSLIPRRFDLLLLLLLAEVGIGKVYANAPWDLAYYRIAQPQPQLDLRAYAQRNRPNELIIVDPNDEFYSMLLPIRGVRYCWLGQIEAVERYAPHLVALGITMPSSQFIDLDKFQPRYDAMLRNWGLPSSEPIATSILARSPADIFTLVSNKPATDFYIPKQLFADNYPQFQLTHTIEPVSADRIFLLARQSPKTVRGTPIPTRAAAL